MLYRRDLALSLGGYRAEFEPCEDVDLFARMLATGSVILIQPEVLMQYRIRPGSVSGRSADLQFQMLRFVYHNFYAARAGRAGISFAEFVTLQKQQPVSKRLGAWAQAQSDRLYRHYSAALMMDRPILAGLYLAGAAALRPGKALRRGLRSTRPRLARP